jgi:phosphoglycolate phosphatase-like HAD superfamily hydrolase
MSRPKKFPPAVFIFDLDGTLVEFPREYIFSQTVRILEEFRHPPVPQSLLEEHFSAFDFFRFVQDPDRDAFIARYWAAFDWINYPKPTPLAGALEVLATLKSLGHRVALATARLDPVDEIRLNLDPTGFLQHLDHIVTRPGEHVHWTDKTGHISQICELFHIDPSEAALIGDIPADVISARTAGVGTSIAVLSGGIRRDVLEAQQPDYVLNDVRDLLSLIRSKK